MRHPAIADDTTSRADEPKNAAHPVRGRPQHRRKQQRHVTESTSPTTHNKGWKPQGESREMQKKTRFCCFPFSAFRKNSQAKRQSTEHTPEELRKNRSSTSGFPIVPDKKHRTRILNRGLYRRRAVQCRACHRAGGTAPPGRCRRRREPMAFTLRGKRGKKTLSGQ